MRGTFAAGFVAGFAFGLLGALAWLAATWLRGAKEVDWCC